MNTLVLLAHLLGLAAALGAAAVKLTLLLWCGSDPERVAAYARVAKPITRVLVTGMVVLAISGVSWLMLGRPFTPALVAKLVLVAAVFVMGPVIDNVAEPAFVRLAPAPGSPVTPPFLRARRRYLALEAAAAALLGAITVLGVVL